MCYFFFFRAEDGIRDLVRSRGRGDVYKRQHLEPLVAAPEVHRPGLAAVGQLDRAVVGEQLIAPVSYTHLTLPTIYSVSISVVAVALKKKTQHKTPEKQ